MKQLITFAAIALFSLSASAQQNKTIKKVTPKTETCCSMSDADGKKMTAAEIKKCQAKCKKEGKTCAVVTEKKADKSCCIKKA